VTAEVGAWATTDGVGCRGRASRGGSILGARSKEAPVTYPTTPSGDDPTRDFGAPPVGQPPAPSYPPAPGSMGGEPAAYPPGYPTATYPAAGWPQAAPPVPPKRSMTWFWVTIAAVVVVAVLAISAVGVVLLSRSGGGSASATGSSPTHEPKPSEEPSEESADDPADPGDSVKMPDTVGGLHKSNNPAYDGVTDQLAEQMEGLIPSTAHVGVGVYDDPDSTLGMAMVMRMDLDVVGSTAGAVDGAFNGMKGMGKVSGLHSVKAPAPLTGPGKCGNVESQGINMAVCVAADGHTVSIVMFMERSAKEVEDQFGKIRLDLVP